MTIVKLVSACKNQIAISQTVRIENTEQQSRADGEQELNRTEPQELMNLIDTCHATAIDFNYAAGGRWKRGRGGGGVEQRSEKVARETDNYKCEQREREQRKQEYRKCYISSY